MELANRGKQFEKILETSFGAFGGHTIVKTDPAVTRIGGKDAKGRFTAVHGAKGQCDFEGCFAGLGVCLEAKDCSVEVFLKSRIRTHQWERMGAVWQMGGISGLLLRFAAETADRDEAWLVPFDVVVALFVNGARFTAASVSSFDAHALAYGALGGRAVYFPGLQAALLSEAHRSFRGRLQKP